MCSDDPSVRNQILLSVIFIAASIYGVLTTGGFKKDMENARYLFIPFVHELLKPCDTRQMLYSAPPFFLYKQSLVHTHIHTHTQDREVK